MPLAIFYTSLCLGFLVRALRRAVVQVTVWAEGLENLATVVAQFNFQGFSFPMPRIFRAKTSFELRGTLEYCYKSASHLTVPPVRQYFFLWSFAGQELPRQACPAWLQFCLCLTAAQIFAAVCLFLFCWFEVL